MPSSDETTIHEVDFCGKMATAAEHLFHANPDAYVFHEARIEGFGTAQAGANARTSGSMSSTANSP